MLSPLDDNGDAAPGDVHASLLALRARAEKRRYLITQATEHHTPEETQRLVQELQVHQIELEMQYEELLLAQAEAQAARAQYVDLYEFAPVGYFTLSATGLIEQLNLHGSQLLGTVRQRLAQRRFALFVLPAQRLAFGQFLALVLSTDTTQSAELLLQREDGTTFYAQLEGLRVSGHAGPQCRLAVSDASTRHQAAVALAASEARFRKLFSKSSDAVALLQGHQYVECNEAAAHLLGLQRPEELVGQAATAYTPEYQPDGQRSADLFRESIAEAVRTGSKRCEALMHRASGGAIWVEVVLTPIEIDGSQPLLHLVWRDVTAARTAAEALRASQERLELALSASETGVFTWNLTTNQLEWDARAQAVFGLAFSPRPVSREVLTDAVHPADAARVLAAISAAVDHGTALALDYRVAWPDGSVHHVSSAGRMVADGPGRPRSFAGVLRDVTALYAAEEEVREGRERLQLALAASGSGVWEWQLAGHQLNWDARAQAIFGRPYHPAPVSFEVLQQAVHPADQPAVSTALKRAFEENVLFDLEHRIIRPDGEVRYVAAQGRVVHDAHGQPQRLTGIVRDVTQRREAELALRQQKEFTESLLDNTVDGILALDSQGRITAWNTEIGRYFGYEAAAVLGHPVFDVLSFLDEKSHQAVRQALGGEAVVCPGRPFVVRPGQYDAYLVPLKDDADDQPSSVLVIIRDVTERNRLTEEATQLRLRQQQEVLAAILTTQESERKRIAEALHNGLGQLLFATKLILEDKKGSAVRLRESLKLLDEAIRTTRTISFELTPGILEDFGLRTALETLVKRLTPARLPVRLHLTNLDARLPGPVEITVYRTVQELLNNVMKHAQATEVEVHVAHENGHLLVSVEDNGRGFEPMLHAGQPLTGIGLAGVRNRVALLGGTLTMKSQLGRGTIMSFELTV